MLKSLAHETLAIATECLRAAVEGPFFPDWECGTLFGVDRDTVRVVYDAWPEQTIGPEEFRCAIVGSANHLLGYPHRQEAIWSDYISVSPERVRKALDALVAIGFSLKEYCSLGGGTRLYQGHVAAVQSPFVLERFNAPLCLH